MCIRDRFFSGRRATLTGSPLRVAVGHRSAPLADAPPWVRTWRTFIQLDASFIAASYWTFAADQPAEGIPRVVRISKSCERSTEKCFFSSFPQSSTSGFVHRPTTLAMYEYESPWRCIAVAVASSTNPSNAEILISTTAGAIADALPE